MLLLSQSKESFQVHSRTRPQPLKVSLLFSYVADDGAERTLSGADRDMPMKSKVRWFCLCVKEAPWTISVGSR